MQNDVLLNNFKKQRLQNKAYKKSKIKHYKYIEYIYFSQLFLRYKIFNTDCYREISKLETLTDANEKKLHIFPILADFVTRKLTGHTVTANLTQIETDKLGFRGKVASETSCIPCQEPKLKIDII